MTSGIDKCGQQSIMVDNLGFSSHLVTTPCAQSERNNHTVKQASSHLLTYGLW